MYGIIRSWVKEIAPSVVIRDLQLLVDMRFPIQKRQLIREGALEAGFITGRVELLGVDGVVFDATLTLRINEPGRTLAPAIMPADHPAFGADYHLRAGRDVSHVGDLAWRFWGWSLAECGHNTVAKVQP